MFYAKCFTVCTFVNYSLLRDYGPQWFDQRLKSSLPLPLDERDKACLKLIPWYARSDNCDLYQVGLEAI